MEQSLKLTVGLPGRGFNPSHPVHFFLLYNYGIILSLILVFAGQKEI
jgi:hypothetical protein